MTTITVTRWHPGFNKVGFTKLLHERIGLKLATAKRHTDELLAGHVISVEVLDQELARKLSRDIAALGAESYVRESDSPTAVASTETRLKGL